MILPDRGLTKGLIAGTFTGGRRNINKCSMHWEA